MSDRLVLALAAMLLLLGGALALWAYARQRRVARQAASVLEARLLARQPAGEAPAAARGGAAAPALTVRGAGPWARLALRAGLRPGWRGAVAVAAPSLLLTLACAVVAEPGVALMAALVGLALTALVLGLRIQKQHRLMVQALPPFIDAMVRLLAVGQSIPAAFMAATPTVRGPLRPVLEAAAQRIRGGGELDASLEQVGRVWRLEPLLLFAAIVRMSIQYGGRVDQVLERVARFMRDREEAQQELVALSAETRLSAWVLALLPAGVALLILFFNAAYLSRMWVDPSGRSLLLAAFGLQAFGSLLMVRLARLR